MVKTISDKLRNSIENRVCESYSGRILIPSDIKKRYMKETLCDEPEAITEIIKISTRGY